MISRFGLDPAVYLFVYLDLGIVGPNSAPTQLYQHLLRRIASRIEDPGLKEQITGIGQQDKIDSYDLTDAFEAINGKGLHIVLLMDEFEIICSNADFGTEFFYSLRSLAIHYNMAIITASGRDLVEISQSDEVRSSPFFNIFATVNLQPFTRAEVEELLNHSLGGSGISFSQEDIEHAVKLAGLHPHFLQIAFWHLFDGYQKHLSRADLEEFVDTEFLRQALSQLQGYWQDSDEEEKVLLALLALLDNTEHGTGRLWPPDELHRWHSRAGGLLSALTRRGLVSRTDNAYALFSEAFSQWIVGEITAPSPSLSGPEGSAVREEVILSSLPTDLARRIGDWISKTNTRYRGLFVRWLSEPETSEAAFELLERAKVPFRDVTLTSSAIMPAGQVSGIKALLVHPYERAQQGLRRVLEEHKDIEVVGEAHNAIEAMSQVDTVSPDVVLLDAEMPEADGLEIVSILKDRAFPGAVVVLSIDAQADEIVRAMSQAPEGGFFFGASLMGTAWGQEVARRYLAGQQLGGAQAPPAPVVETGAGPEESEEATPIGSVARGVPEERRTEAATTIEEKAVAGQTTVPTQGVAETVSSPLTPALDTVVSNVELVISPPLEPVIILKLHKWLQDDAFADIEEIVGSLTRDTVLRMTIHQPVPLVQMLAELPYVTEVSEEMYTGDSSDLPGVFKRQAELLSVGGKHPLPTRVRLVLKVE